MVIYKYRKLKLQAAYDEIINRLNNTNLTYETENHIIQEYDPDARDEYGQPYPKPEENTVGTGTAWIKYYFKGKKIGYIFFCCHIVDCDTCNYDRFITVYNYTDDVMDTFIEGDKPLTAIMQYPYTKLLEPGYLYYKPYTITAKFECPFPITDKDGNKTIPVVSEDVTVYQFYCDAYRDEDRNPLPILPYNLDDTEPDEMDPAGGLIPKTYGMQVVSTVDEVLDESKLYLIGEFDVNETDIDKILTKIKFYNPSYKNIQNTPIPMNVIKYIHKTGNKNDVLYDDLIGTLNGVQTHIDESNYAQMLSTILNYTTHCVTKTFTDVGDVDGVWNFILYKDRNLPLIPLNDSVAYLIADGYIDYLKDPAVYTGLKLVNLNNNGMSTNYDAIDINKQSEQLLGYYISEPMKTTIYASDINAVYQQWFIHLNPQKTLNSKTIECSGTCLRPYNTYTKLSLDYDKANIKIEVDYNITLKLKSDIDIKYLHPMEAEEITAKDKDSWISGLINSGPEMAVDMSNDSTPGPWSLRVTLQPTYDKITDTVIWPEKIECSNKRYNYRCSYYNFLKLYEYSRMYGWQDIYEQMDITYNVRLLWNDSDSNDGVYNNLINSEIRYIPAEYNFNTVPEGVFQYYHEDRHSYINSYLFYSYNYPWIDLLHKDTYELQKEFKYKFFNFFSKEQLKGIYIKDDSHNHYMKCDVCNTGDIPEEELVDVNCVKCKNTRYIQEYNKIGNDFHKRYPCSNPTCMDNSFNKTKRLNYDIKQRCRCCAGTGNRIYYLYYNCYEFKDLSVYDRKTPVSCNLNVLPTVDEVKALTIKLKWKDEPVEWPYLNYLLYNKFEIFAGTELDDKYDKYYKYIMDNIVLFKYNGKITRYYYWNGVSHMEVKYGYKFIYSTKTYTSTEWEKIKDTDEAHNNKYLYRVFIDVDHLNDLIGFYALSYSNNVFERIYFEPKYVYNLILTDSTCKDFNMLECGQEIVNSDDHIHKDDMDPEDLKLNWEYVYKYVSKTSLSCDNLNFEVYHIEEPKE